MSTAVAGAGAQHAGQKQSERAAGHPASSHYRLVDQVRQECVNCCTRSKDTPRSAAESRSDTPSVRSSATIARSITLASHVDDRTTWFDATA